MKDSTCSILASSVVDESSSSVNVGDCGELVLDVGEIGFDIVIL